MSARIAVTAALVALAVALVFRPTPSAQGGDLTPPTVTAQSPAGGAAGVSTLINAKAAFSEPIQASTLVMELRNSSNVVQSAQVTYDPATRTATLDPDNELAGSHTFTVRVSAARDLAGNQMSLVSWSFTTATPGFQDVTLPQTGLVNPVVMQFASDGRIFVAEKSGRVYFYDSPEDSTPTFFADLRTNVHNFWDRGMLGMVLHPAFPVVPYIYVLYTFDAVLPSFAPPRFGTAGATNDTCADPTGNGCVVTGRLSRLNANQFAGTPLNSTNETVLVEEWWQQFPSHSIGSLVFGADGALYATGGDGASFNYVDYGPPSSPTANPPAGDPANEGGALRSQDLRTSGDPFGLSGSAIRIDPDTGAALPDNPLFGNPNANARRIVAYGFRNPFRFTIKPGTNELWVGDVGWSTWEEINRIPDPLDVLVKNFGWPCYEGSARQSGYDSANRPICETLYGESPAQSGLTAPHYAYNHSQQIVGGEACPTGSSSISGLAFYPESGGAYPSSYNGALFFSDYSRDCIWAMRVGAGGLPDPANIVTVKPNPGAPREGPVHLVSGPGGDIYFAGIDDGRLHRIRYNSGNQPPTAVVQANPTAGPSPLTVTFNASGSSDPEGQALTYAWDLDGDGAFDDATVAAPQFTYTSGTSLGVTVRLRTTDSLGLSDVRSTVISVNNTAPTPVITTPGSAFTWKVGDPIDFAGGANDPEQGPLPASSLLWSVIMHHCPSNCHSHNITDYVGIASGAFAAPDHEFPSYLELRLVATDSGGLQGTASVNIHPQTVPLTFASSPAGLQLAVNAAAQTTPFTRTVIVGSSNSVSAPSPQTPVSTTYQFSAWSDGGGQTHTIVAPATAATYTATYSTVIAPTGLVAAYGMSEGNGPTLGDWTGTGHTGTITGATWTTQGKFASALVFDGVNDWVTVNDANDLDFTTGMTLEAWVYPTASGGGSWRNVMIKERAGGEVFNLYANADTNTPTVYAVGAGQPGAPLDARGTAAVPLNTWTHLAVSYDGTTMRLFVNSVQVGSRAVASPLLTSTGALRLGGNSIWGEFFQGRIDEVRIYQRSLSQTEIQTDMNTPVGTPPADTTPPVRSNGQPTGTLPPGTTQTTLSLTTDENATCRYSTTAGIAYGTMTGTFTTTGGTAHAAPVSGLVNGGSYTYFVRCQDGASTPNPNTTDFPIAFSVANPPPPDITLPAVSMTAPAPAATVFGSVTVSATATDNVGVVGVQFLLNGAPLGAEDTTAPYSMSWNSTSVANGGPYQLSARARDAATNQATAAAVSVTVNNTNLGLVAAYSFDQGSGTTLADRTGTGHTGAITGATWTTQGKFASALTFDGVNDWVTVNDANDLDFTTGMTVEAWVYPTASGGGSWRNVAIKERAGGEVYNLYANADTDAPRVYVVGAAQPGAPLEAGGTAAVPLNTWTHLTVSYDGTTLRLYVNGAQVGSRAVASPLLTSTGVLRIGGNGVWGEFFQGRIDEVRLYNRALSATEIQADMNAPVQ